MNSTKRTFLAAGCLALNLSLAKVAAIFALPVYLDSVGTILGAVLLPLPFTLVVAVSTSVLGGFLVNPYFPAYFFTQIVIGLVAVLCSKKGLFNKPWTSILAGFLIAFTAVIASAPVTVLLFGGVTLSGTTAINAVLIAMGHNLWTGVIGGSLFTESIDKPIASFLAYIVLKRLPTRIKTIE